MFNLKEFFMEQGIELTEYEIAICESYMDVVYEPHELINIVLEYRKSLGI